MSFKNYPFEFNKPLKLCIKMLNNCNIRLYKEDSSSLKIYWSYFFMSVCVILHFASLTKFLIEVFSEKTEAVDLAFTIPIYVIIIQAIFKAAVLISNKKEIRFIIHELGTTWRKDNITEVQTHKKNVLLRKLEICQRTFYHMTMVGSYIYSLTPLVELILRRFIWRQEVKLLLPYPCSYPFDPFQNWVIYTGVYVFQTYSTYCYIYAYLGAEFLMVALCSHISTEFSLLREDMQNVQPFIKNIEESHANELTITIGDFVKKHQRLIKLSQQLDDIFNKINFVIFCFATITICFFAFGCKVAHGMYKTVNYLAVTGILVPLLILCYYSEMLRVESTGIAKGAYNNLWHNKNINYQKSIALIIMRSQKPCSLTSLKYTPITLNTFSKVLSTTWSYYSLITRLYEE